MSSELLKHIPIKKYDIEVDHPDCCSVKLIESESGRLIATSDLETLLTKLGQPQVLKKVLNAFMFGQSVKWEEILKD